MQKFNGLRGHEMNQYNDFELLTKDDIIKKSHEGFFVQHYGTLGDMDGAKVRRYLESKGFVVVSNKDVGTNGLVLTACGIKMSTNGFAYRNDN